MVAVRSNARAAFARRWYDKVVINNCQFASKSTGVKGGFCAEKATLEQRQTESEFLRFW
jgi:hypothetical protein